MFRNYLLITFRNFKNQKLFSLLNVFGLALGLASALLIFLYVSDELRYDNMQPHYGDTYRIGLTFINAQGERYDNTVSPGYLVRTLKDNNKEVALATRFDYIGYPTSLNYKAADKIVLTEEIRWAEPGFDKILYFDLLRGNRETMFKEYNSILLSETGARRLFGTEDPMGKVISLKHFWATNDREIDLMVTGIYRDYPANSHFKPQYLVNLNAMHSVQGDHFNDYLEGTRMTNNIEFFENYIVLRPGGDIKKVNAQLAEMAKQLLATDSIARTNGFKMEFFTTKLSDLHFDNKNIWEYDSHGNKVYLTIFSVIAIMIMIIACINYTNLATARSIKRSKEVGLRKTFGSYRYEIALQFFLESFIMTFAALLMSLVLAIAFLGPFNHLAHKSFTVASLFDPYMMGIMFLTVIFMTVVSGLYPAVYLSGFMPARVLKGQLVRGKGAELFRKSLVTIQYTVAMGLIIYTFIVIRQMDQLKSTKLNERGNQIMAIRFGGIARQDRFEIFKRAVLKDPQIENVTMGNHLPRLDYFGWIGAQVKFPAFGDKELQWNQLNVDFDFTKTFNLEILDGRDFQLGNINDSNTVILNQAAVKALGQPAEKVLGASLRDRRDTSHFYQVVGIVKDFPFRSQHQPIEPLMLIPRLHSVDAIAYIKLPAGKFSEKISDIEKKWKATFPGAGFDHWFVNDEFNRMYKSENTVSALARAFAVLAVLITVLGVFSLASYTVEQRTKEIGIRKVLGAGDNHVVTLFVMIFVKIFAIASLVAVPVAWFVSYKWLQGFAYRVNISPLIFIWSLMGLLLITLATVSYEIWKSARANPVKALRTE